MFELLKSLDSEIDCALSDWYDDCNSFLTSFLSFAFDGLISSIAHSRGAQDV